MSPLYSGGRTDSAASVLSFLDGQIVLETDEAGVTRVYAEAPDGDAPALGKAGCAEIGAALVELSQEP